MILKILLVLKGHHYRFTRSRSFTYLNTIRSVSNHLIRPLALYFDDFRLCLHTYESPLISDLCLNYTPSFFYCDSSSNFTLLSNFHLLLSRLKSIDLTDTFIIISRFDICFRHPIDPSIFQDDMFNFLFPCAGMTHRIWFDDNLIGFPSNYIDLLLHLCSTKIISCNSFDYHHKNLHWLLPELCLSTPLSDALNCIDPRPMRSDSNIYYYLFRGTNFMHNIKSFISRF